MRLLDELAEVVLQGIEERHFGKFAIGVLAVIVALAVLVISQ